MSIFQLYHHFVSHRIVVEVTKFLLVSQLLLTLLREVTVEGQPGAPIPLTRGDIQQITDAHNLFRSRVDPPASNMQRIRWSSALATVAQGYAEMCMFDPNPDRTAQAAALFFTGTVGENRAFGRTTNYTALIERGWFVERLNFDFTSIMCLSPGACDEYIQLVWAESNLVGCGAANCPQVTGLPILPNAVVFVCNYAPEGNIPRESPYKAGGPCSNCPSSQPLCIDNLCSSEEDMITTTTAQRTPATFRTPPTSSTEAPMTTTMSVDEEEGSDEGRSRSGSQSNENS